MVIIINISFTIVNEIKIKYIIVKIKKECMMLHSFLYTIQAITLEKSMSDSFSSFISTIKSNGPLTATKE